MHTSPAKKNNGLSRRLGLLAATLTGLGVIIGSGIYVIIGVAAGQAGNAVWLSFVLAAFGASLTALSYARLSRLQPKNAPEYQFVNLAYGSSPAFLAGWLILVAQIVSSAAVALGFAGYLQSILEVPLLPVAAGLIVIASIVLYTGIGQSAAAAIVLTCIEILGLLIIIGIGLPRFGQVDYFEMPLGIAGVFSAASLVFFAFLGFEGMANLSEEMHNPEKNLPKAILLALSLSTVFYVLVALSAVSVTGWEELSRTGAPLARVAETALGSNAGFILALISLASTANTVLILLLASSRILHAMARARVLPGILDKINKSRHTPWLAIIVVGVISIMFAMIGNIEEVAGYTNFITLLAFIGVNASLIKIFSGKHGNSFKGILVNRVAPLLGIGVSGWLAYNTGWKAAVFGLAVVITGFIVFLFTRLLNRS